MTGITKTTKAAENDGSTATRRTTKDTKDTKGKAVIDRCREHADRNAIQAENVNRSQPREHCGPAVRVWAAERLRFFVSFVPFVVLLLLPEGVFPHDDAPDARP